MNRLNKKISNKIYIFFNKLKWINYKNDFSENPFELKGPQENKQLTQFYFSH